MHVADLSLKVTDMANRTTLHQRRRKRAQPPVFSGISGSYEDKDSDFLWLVFEIKNDKHTQRPLHTIMFAGGFCTLFQYDYAAHIFIHIYK